MATSPEFVEYVCEQLAGAGLLRYRKMFGEYMVYVDERPVLLVCDDTVYVKKVDAVAELLAGAETGVPYEGAKEHYILDIDNAPLCRAVTERLVAVTPLPKPKQKKTPPVTEAVQIPTGRTVEGYFAGEEALLPLFRALESAIVTRWDDTRERVLKTQISFDSKRPFCIAWLPRGRNLPGWRGQYLIVTVGWTQPLDTPRAAVCTEPYPGRFTHHIPITRIEEIDEELLGWIAQAREWRNGV